jgi:hypothetical protein
MDELKTIPYNKRLSISRFLDISPTYFNEGGTEEPKQQVRSGSNIELGQSTATEVQKLNAK